MTAVLGLDPIPEFEGRTFQLTVLPGSGDQYGLRLEEIYGHAQHIGLVAPVITASPLQVYRVIEAVLAAVRNSGHRPGVLSLDRSRPIYIDEAAGVRLALALLAAAPLTRGERIRAVLGGIATMSVEETYYWYAKCQGSDSNRTRKALRILLGGGS